MTAAKVTAAGGIAIRAACAADRPWIDALTRDAWGGPTVVSGDNEHVVADLPGLVALFNGERAGLVTLHCAAERCEVVTLNSLQPGRGIGQALLTAAVEQARRAGCRDLWLLTTNDNTRALRFYQMFGMRISAWRGGEIERQRRSKPTIPLLGDHGIPIRDEIELVLTL
jgi:ribosomal protein S18 acetylase RimI-like enzyme